MSDSNKSEVFKTAREALEQPLDLVKHEDPEKHLIGQSLPVASNEELQPVGVNTTAGASTFPARADHVHGIRSPWSAASLTPAQTIAPGSNVHFSPWVNSPLANAENWTSNPDDSFMNFPRAGLYMVHINIKLTRSGGGAFAAGTVVTHGISLTNSGGTLTYIHKNQVVGGFTQYYINEAQMHFADIDNSTCRVFVNHNDAVNWSADTGQWIGAYLSSVE